MITILSERHVGRVLANSPRSKEKRIAEDPEDGDGRDSKRVACRTTW
jgi:hypothetical protein